MQLSLNSYFSPSFKKQISLFIILLFSSLFFNQTLASSVTFDENIKFKHLTAADGLSQNNVFDIVQDKEGFIWIATENGLNRYDGQNIVKYRKNIANTNSIADNFIRKLFIDNNDTLWVGTANGLSKYNSHQDNFENFYYIDSIKSSLSDNVIWDIFQDRRYEDKDGKKLGGTIWVSTENNSSVAAINT